MSTNQILIGIGLINTCRPPMAELSHDCQPSSRCVGQYLGAWSASPSAPAA